MTREITLNHITKIEGHATLCVQVDGGVIKKCELSSVEGSRYFEGIVRGRRFDEASEITSRICGICSCAHTVAAITAIEDCLGVKPSKQTLELRKLLMIGERIRSHATHLYFLALPDYVGCESALAMLPKYEKEVKRALALMQVGNQLVKAVGGRDLHPVSATVGGFLAVPTGEELAAIGKSLKANEEAVADTAKLFGSLKQPDFSQPTQCFSLYDGRGYPLLGGDVMVGGKRYSKDKYHEYLAEYHEPHSTANFVVREGKSYLVGALARVNNNWQFLSSKARRLAGEAGFKAPSANPFDNNYCQALELVHYFDEAQQIIKNLGEPQLEPIAPHQARQGRGIAAIEVPRGVLWHEYTLDKSGTITAANIITPTAQNLRSMQDDIRAFLPRVLKYRRDRIALEVEKLIRAYDPCFSCSTHFLKVKWLDSDASGQAASPVASSPANC